MSQPGVKLVSWLEGEFRHLAAEARSKDGISAFFSSAADQQAVKDAAERVILKLRTLSDSPDGLEVLKTQYQVSGAHVAVVVGRRAPPMPPSLHCNLRRSY